MVPQMRILIVAWAWPPIGRVGALRPLGMAREWVAAGHEVHVLTGPGDRGGEAAPDLLPLAAASGARVHRADAPGLPLATSAKPVSSKPRRISRLRQVIGQWRGFPDLQRCWIGPARAEASRLVSTQRFDVVWSTSPPESVHFVARHVARHGVPWVADFRDQWSEYLLARWDPVSRMAIDRISRWALSEAAAIVANSEGVALSIRRTTGRDVVCVRNGFDPVEPARALVFPRTLGYFGRIDPLMQRPERLWPALRQARETGDAWRVRFYLTGGGGGGLAPAVPSDLASLVETRAPLPHPEAVREMQRMTALLVLGWEVRGGDAPVAGKLYEYVGSGRPVLVCAPPHYEARRLVEESGTGVGAWSATEIAEALRRLEHLRVPEESRRAFSRETSARQLLEVLRRASSSAG